MEEYITPEIEVITFEAEDIVTSSPNAGDNEIPYGGN